MGFLKKLGAALYEHVFVHYKPTLVGIACATGIEIIGATTDYLQSVPVGWQHAIAGLAVIVGSMLKQKLAAKVVGAGLALLLCLGTARAEDVNLKPATLCAIGSQGNWCYGVLPAFGGPGVDVKHGVVVANAQFGASLAATWMAGQLKSLTVGLHASFAPDSAGIPTVFNLGGTFAFLKGYAAVNADWQAVGGNHAFIIAPALGLPL